MLRETDVIKWEGVFVLVVIHAGSLLGLRYILTASWETLVFTLFLVVYSLEGTLVGAHRLWSHKSFKANKAVQIFLLVGQTIAGQVSVMRWVREHRMHHRYLDTDADPYNAKRGFFFSHFGWIMVQKHPEFEQKVFTINMSDLTSDPLIVFQEKHYVPLFVLLGVVLPIFLPVLLWSETMPEAFFVCFILRYTYVNNAIFCINSFAHEFGTKPYNRKMSAVESLTTNLCTGGEGWHNFHHAFPWDWRASELGSPLNLSAAIIEALARLGWAWDLRSAGPATVARVALARGDGSYSKEPRQHHNPPQLNTS